MEGRGRDRQDGGSLGVAPARAAARGLSDEAPRAGSALLLRGCRRGGRDLRPRLPGADVARGAAARLSPDNRGAPRSHGSRSRNRAAHSPAGLGRFPGRLEKGRSFWFGTAIRGPSGSISASASSRKVASGTASDFQTAPSWTTSRWRGSPQREVTSLGLKRPNTKASAFRESKVARSIRVGMVDPAANYGGTIPEYYDRCLGPAWFDAFAAGSGAALTGPRGGQRAGDRLRNWAGDPSTAGAHRSGAPVVRQRHQQGNAGLRAQEADPIRWHRMARGGRGQLAVRRRRVQRGGLRLRRHVRAGQASRIPGGTSGARERGSLPVQCVGPAGGKPRLFDQRKGRRGSVSRGRGSSLQNALRDARSRRRYGGCSRRRGFGKSESRRSRFRSTGSVPGRSPLDRFAGPHARYCSRSAAPRLTKWSKRSRRHWRAQAGLTHGEVPRTQWWSRRAEMDSEAAI